MTGNTDIRSAAIAVLGAAEPADKLAALNRMSGTAHDPATGCATPPVRPARPARPRLCAPRDMPKRNLRGSRESRAAFIHAIAHIEFNAIDLACDMIARFYHHDLSAEFAADWRSVAQDEGRHFELLNDRLAEMGFGYGDFPAHDGLWQAAIDTRDDILARLSLVPLTLEARGLDVTPDMIKTARATGDKRTADIFSIIYEDEIDHVATGQKWFDLLCRKQGLDPVTTYRKIIAQRFRGGLKPPFNETARSKAGMPQKFYQPIT